MRRTLLIGVSALAFALAGAAATRSATPPKQAACGQTLVIILFWPHGHGSIPSVGLAADRKPHLEVYKYGTHGYPRKNFVAYANAIGRSRFAAGCETRIGGFPSGAIFISTPAIALPTEPFFVPKGWFNVTIGAVSVRP